MERLDAFMARANAAYYARQDPFADFTTAPEISQVFGELLGLWAAVTWQAMGCPEPVTLAEAGPGRGTLMRDALRAIRQTMPAFEAALRVHFIERSDRLRLAQRRLVADAVWHDEVAELPERPMILLANEFLDALPIRQLVQGERGWGERFVQDAAFVVVPAVGEPLDVIETCEAACGIVATVAARVVRDGGAALIVDYGPETSAPGDSLQALRGGRFANPLDDPGGADLTAHVDFAALAKVAREAGAAVHGPLAQGLFLARLGLFQRTDRLAQGRVPARAAALIEAAQRLAEPAAMGRLFKVLALSHPALPVPPGFVAS